MGFASPHVNILQSLVTISLLEKQIFHFKFVTLPHVITFDFLDAILHHKSATCQVLWPYACPKRINYVFNLSRVHTWPLGPRVIWLNRWVPLTISHQLAMFGDDRPCEREDVKFSIFREIPRDHMIRESCAVMGWFPLIISSQHPARFGCYKRCAREDVSFSSVYVVRESREIIGEFLSS